MYTDIPTLIFLKKVEGVKSLVLLGFSSWSGEENCVFIREISSSPKCMAAVRCFAPGPALAPLAAEGHGPGPALVVAPAAGTPRFHSKAILCCFLSAVRALVLCSIPKLPVPAAAATESICFVFPLFF